MSTGKKVIETDEFYLREWLPGDGMYHFLLNSDEDVVKYTGDRAFSSREEAEQFNLAYDQFEKNGCGRWLLFLKDGDQFAGWCGLKYHQQMDAYDLGYRLMKQFWGRGLATKSGSEVLRFGKACLPAKRIFAKAAIENKASIRVLEKLGFSISGAENDHGMEVYVFDEKSTANEAEQNLSFTVS